MNALGGPPPDIERAAEILGLPVDQIMSVVPWR